MNLPFKMNSILHLHNKALLTIIKSSMKREKVNLQWKHVKICFSGKLAQCAAPLARCIMPISTHFWRPSPYPNWAQDSSFERSSCLVSGTSWIVSFRGHVPPKNGKLPRLLLCGQKEAERSFLGSFWTFRWSRFASKLLKISRVHVLILLNPNMQIVSPFDAPSKSAAPLGKIPVLKITKFQKCKKFPKFAQIWHGTPPSATLMG